MKTEFQIDSFAANKYKILQDFEIFLDYISFSGIEISKKNHRICTEAVTELNKKISKNLKLDLKQHNQSSYPHISSLILLYRATGFGEIKLVNDKFVLTINEDMHKQWRNLNETEKYFNLFITWICNGVPSIIGIEADFFLSSNNLLQFMTGKHPDYIIQSETKSLKSVNYSVGTHNLTLLDMFGFVEIIDNSNELSNKWEIKELKFTQLGIYIFKLIKEMLKKKSNEEFYSRATTPISIKNSLQKTLKSLFKEYKSDMQLPIRIEIENDLVFKVRLGRVWRKISVPSNYSLNNFCDYIIDCFEFDHTHLYQISTKNRFGYIETYTHPEIDDDFYGNPNSADYTLKSLHINAGTILDFTYDFGDNWQFEIFCEKVDTVLSKKPRVIEKKGKTPEQYNNNKL